MKVFVVISMSPTPSEWEKQVYGVFSSEAAANDAIATMGDSWLNPRIKSMLVDEEARPSKPEMNNNSLGREKSRADIAAEVRMGRWADR